MPEPAPTLSRRAARANMRLHAADQARHARASVADRVRRGVLLVSAALLLIGAAVAVTAVAGSPVAGETRLGEHSVAPPLPAAAPVTALPVPAQSMVTAASCATPAVAAALETGTDADVITAFGGAGALRDAVVGGRAPCVSLSAADRVWVVVNKRRPLDPPDYVPASFMRPEAMQRTADVRLRPDAAAALTALVAAAADEGAGAIGLNSAYRSYASQQSTYRGYVNSLGKADADLTSARAGHSEHQTGIAADLVACSRGCGGIEAFAGTSQASWLADNAWRFGFIVRYEDGQTATTGYEWEPWHVRYLGAELAAAYHEGGFHSLEAFFGLPAAPDYGD
ncbi:M15 family metallopeptidase [Microbacterium sp.]|uniref:M15 family metallopeptidase n=1 Tax=Microbacterium sp. TaxID=51671 RepID=UPI0025FBBF03|nr:M15 family metallopeptidase [Microbacterium sp.]